MLAQNSVCGRVALVTGAASGIGLATARLLKSHGAVIYAADVTELDVDGQSATGATHTDWTNLSLDVRSEAAWERAIDRVLHESGRLDILVHAAGVSSASPLPETSFDEWRRVLSTNLDGTFLAIRHGLRALPARRRDRRPGISLRNPTLSWCRSVFDEQGRRQHACEICA